MSQVSETPGWLPPAAGGDWPPEGVRRDITRRRIALREVMERIEASAARASGQPDWSSRMAADLAELKDALDAHVSEVEESGGLFDDVIERAPHLTPMVDALRRDHAALLAEAAETLDLARAPGGVEPALLRRRVLIVLRQLVEHRQDGAELLFDAYNVELAAGD